MPRLVCHQELETKSLDHHSSLFVVWPFQQAFQASRASLNPACHIAGAIADGLQGISGGEVRPGVVAGVWPKQYFQLHTTYLLCFIHILHGLEWVSHVCLFRQQRSLNLPSNLIALSV